MFGKLPVNSRTTYQPGLMTALEDVRALEGSLH
jgi:hypothetical protein